MMKEEGHHVEFVWGEGMDGFIPPFDPDTVWWKALNQRAIQRWESAAPGYLCITAGTAQRPVADALPQLTPVEVGVGYGGTFTDFRVFESYAWMHTVYGADTHGDAHAADGRFYDAVIPNAYRRSEFPLGKGEGRYLLYIGRNIDRKGVQVARDTAERAKLPLVEVGPGFERTVGPAERARLMGDARAVMVPTLYVEPFGGAHVEAMMCGTPVITTDWGVFTETVENGVNGFRCRTLAEFAAAANDVQHLSRETIRHFAQRRFSTDVVAPQYTRYFERLDTLRGEGWYS
jgi:glycosyltransferase involved in cell wall biosynthesis